MATQVDRVKAFDLLAFWSLNIVIVVHSASKALFCTVCSSDRPTFGRKSLNWKGSKKKREKRDVTRSRRFELQGEAKHDTTYPSPRDRRLRRP